MIAQDILDSFSTEAGNLTALGSEKFAAREWWFMSTGAAG
jgi:hypothetical protein